MGKTQLAAESAYRHEEVHEVVWWVRTEELVVLASDYAGPARELMLPESDEAEQRIVARVVRRWLGAARHGLLWHRNSGILIAVSAGRPRFRGIPWTSA